VPQVKVTPGVLPLTFSDAIERALRQNLAGLLSEYNTIQARGQKWQQLSELLPKVNGNVQENDQKQSLIAIGFGKFPAGLFGGRPLPSVIGPFAYFDARASATERFDWKAIQQYRAAAISEGVARFNLKDARDLVVLATGAAYLQAIAGAARVETAQAQQDTAKALYEKAVAQQQAGVAPAIDTLRAQVEYQSRQQQLISATNDFAKQKISLARVIGLAPGQEFELADKAPYDPFPVPDLESSLQRAYELRSDYKAAHDRVTAARLEHNAAIAGYLPTFSVEGDYGEIGGTPNSVLPTYHVAGTLSIPIFQGGKVHADVLKAEAGLRQAEAQFADVKGQIDQDIRNALLDLKSSAEQVEVAQSSVDLAEQALTQSRDRFSAGVTDNLEVIQSQEALAAAHESLISSLYLHNLAKVSFARALGRAEEGIREYLRGK
jgi:outer membrane protein TolC